MSLCLVAIFKNESTIMDEWIQHYIKQGVDHFFLVDNGSNDNYQDILNKYSNITLNIDSTPNLQVEHYNNYCLNKSKEYEWVVVCDLDEFIYARKGFKTIKDFLAKLHPGISQVFIPWKIFGSSGYNTMDHKHPESVIKHFTKRINYDKDSNFQGVIFENNEKYSLTKCIVRTKYLNKIGMHSSDTSTNSHWVGPDQNKTIHSNNAFYKIDESILANSYLHLNHYAIQSYDWFMRVKATRGDASSMDHNNTRNETYFREFDQASNDIDDFELRDFTINNKEIC